MVESRSAELFAARYIIRTPADDSNDYQALASTIRDQLGHHPIPSLDNLRVGHALKRRVGANEYKSGRIDDAVRRVTPSHPRPRPRRLVHKFKVETRLRLIGLSGVGMRRIDPYSLDVACSSDCSRGRPLPWRR